MFDDLFEYIKKNWSWFLNLPSGFQAIVFAFIVVLFGTVIMSIFSTAATTTYALSLGLQAPAVDIDAIHSALLANTAKSSGILFVILSIIFSWLIHKNTKQIVRNILFYLSAAAFFGFYGYLLVLYFTPSHHQELLKKLNLGGFTDIVLYENLNDKTEVKHPCKLVLHATNSITCYFPESKTYTKFPAIVIQRIDYGQK